MIPPLHHLKELGPLASHHAQIEHSLGHIPSQQQPKLVGDEPPKGTSSHRNQQQRDSQYNRQMNIGKISNDGELYEMI
ncbi:unnamed protein product [Anisakis simplex]|uniref:Uncharacterized protein n=1 Tax=Anisakis simplex TaxID=6269 RepID=A0A0M3JA15_ANISI|nr:unnamed protein product [Anisakis simplex]